MSVAVLVQPGSMAEPSRGTRPLIVFAGGGTGGHLFPVLAVAEALGIANGSDPSAGPAGGAVFDFAFFGSAKRIDRDLIRFPGAEFVEQSVRPVSLRPWKWPAFYWQWRRSRRICRECFLRHRPAVVVGSGGYASGPPIAEAAALGIPTLLLNPDAVPGRANRYLAKMADQVCVQWGDSCAHFGGGIRTVVTGCPIRARFRSATRSGGIAHFDLDPQRRTLLVTGASLGAASINGAMLELAAELIGFDDWQILHLAGARDCERTEAGYRAQGIKARVVAFTERMAEAMAAADLIVGRAGASTLAEICALGKPSILLPYPHQSDLHQRANARVLASRGAACLVEDAVEPGPTAARLREILFGLMRDEGALARMGAAARRLGIPDAAERVAGEVRSLVANGRATISAAHFEYQEAPAKNPGLRDAKNGR